jgi:hypothetical protein
MRTPLDFAREFLTRNKLLRTQGSLEVIIAQAQTEAYTRGKVDGMAMLFGMARDRGASPPAPGQAELFSDPCDDPMGQPDHRHA